MFTEIMFFRGLGCFHTHKLARGEKIRIPAKGTAFDIKGKQYTATGEIFVEEGRSDLWVYVEEVK